MVSMVLERLSSLALEDRFKSASYVSSWLVSLKLARSNVNAMCFDS